MQNKVLQVICAVLILGVLVACYTAGIYSGSEEYKESQAVNTVVTE